MNVPKIKIYCGACECMVVPDGHGARCRPKSVKGWSDGRRVAWVGDTVHRLDVQLAVQFLGGPPEKWEGEAQLFTSNAAQAAYIRNLEPSLIGRSDHTAGTEFEARYFGRFRVEYLRTTFPEVVESVLAAWQPPCTEGLLKPSGAGAGGGSSSLGLGAFK